jgi:tripartite-type tricarboxylate transporter receptor subunit TctC
VLRVTQCKICLTPADRAHRSQITVPTGSPRQTRTLIAGEVQLAVVPFATAIPNIESGRMRALGVTNTRRNPALPDVPTLQEAGVPGYESLTWYGWYAPARTPKDRIARVNGELSKALQSPDVKQRFAALSVDIVASTPEHLGKYLKEEVEKWGRVVKAMNVKAD